MDRPRWEVGDVLRRYGDAFRQEHAASLSTGQRRVMSALELCRTAALGGHLEECDECQHQRNAYNSCRNRHCTKCQSLARAQWIEDRQAELLDTQYFHVVFTVPEEIAAIAYQNKEVVYDILFRATQKPCAPLRPILNISAPRSASSLSCIVGDKNSCFIPTCIVSCPGADYLPTAPAGFRVGAVSSSPSACSPAFSAACFCSCWKRLLTMASCSSFLPSKNCRSAKSFSATWCPYATANGWSTLKSPLLDPSKYSITSVAITTAWPSLIIVCSTSKTARSSSAIRTTAMSRTPHENCHGFPFRSLRTW